MRMLHDVVRARELALCDITYCYICKRKFEENDKNDKKVKDHCRFTSKYRRAAHSCCNLVRKPKFCPVVFHNLQGYDSHLFIKQLAKTTDNEINEKIECIPSTDEKYISFP